jgi:DNA-binding MarR family transcriptional regulator
MAHYKNLALKNQLCFALYAATHTIVRTYTSKLTTVGLTYPQYLVLLVLWEKDGIQVKQLSEVLNLDSATLSPILKRLEKSGFITRKRNKEDERVVNLFLTKESIALEKDVAEIQKQVACQTGLPKTEFIELKDKLNHLVEAMVGNDDDEKKVA